MKSGASDPFADDEVEADAEATTEVEPGETPAVEAEADPEASAEAEADTVAASAEATETEPVEATAIDPATTGGSDPAASTGRESQESETTAPLELPYIYRRDKVKDERPDVHQLFVRDETDERARDAERDLESMLGEDVYRLDAREAIYLAGMRHLADAADVLREWGYDR